MAISKDEVLNGLAKFKTRQDAFNDEKFVQQSELIGAYKVKGSVETFADLPEQAEAGDVYNIRKKGGTDSDGTPIVAGTNVVRTADGDWDALGGTVDLSGYVEKDGDKVLSTNDFTDAYKTKLDNLTAETITQADIDKIFDGE